MSLEEAFQTVDGVGEVKAKELAAIAREHGESVDVEAFKTGLDYFNEEQYGYAKKFFDRVL